MPEEMQEIARKHFQMLIAFYHASEHNQQLRQQIVSHFTFIGNWEPIESIPV